MMRETRIRRLPMALSALVALALAVLPLPVVLDPFRPDFLVLVVFYWSIESPRAGGLTLAFMAGLALDVIQGVVLGQHALALTLMAAWATHLRLRLRVFSDDVAVPDHFRAPHGLSIRVVLDRRCHGLSRDQFRPLARARHRRVAMAVDGGHAEPLA